MNPSDISQGKIEIPIEDPHPDKAEAMEEEQIKTIATHYLDTGMNEDLERPEKPQKIA